MMALFSVLGVLLLFLRLMAAQDIGGDEGTVQTPFLLPSGAAVAYMPTSHTWTCPSPQYVTRVVAAGNITGGYLTPFTDTWRDAVPIEAVLETCPGDNDVLCNSAAVVPSQFLCGPDGYTLLYDVLWCSLPHTLAAFPRVMWPDVVPTVNDEERLYDNADGFQTHTLPGYKFTETMCVTVHINGYRYPRGPGFAIQRLAPPPDTGGPLEGVEAPFVWTDPLLLPRGVFVHPNATSQERAAAVRNASVVSTETPQLDYDPWDAGVRVANGWPSYRIPTAAAATVALLKEPTIVQRLVFGHGTPVSVAATACARHDDCVAVVARQEGPWALAAVSALTVVGDNDTDPLLRFSLVSVCSLEPHSFNASAAAAAAAPHTHFCPRLTSTESHTATTCQSPLGAAGRATSPLCTCTPAWHQPDLIVPVTPTVSTIKPSQTCVSCNAPLFMESIVLGMDAVPSFVLAPTGETHLCTDPTTPEYINPCGQWGIVDTSPAARQNPLDYTCVCFGVYSYDPETRTCVCPPWVCGQEGTCQTTNDTAVPGCVCEEGYSNADPADPMSPCTVCDAGFFTFQDDRDFDCHAVEDRCPGPFVSLVVTQILRKCAYVLPDLQRYACFVEGGVVVNDNNRLCVDPTAWRLPILPRRAAGRRLSPRRRVWRNTLPSTRNRRVCLRR